MQEEDKKSRLTFIRKTVRNKYYNWKALYRCDCGNIKEIDVGDVKNYRTLSCGCLQLESVTKHGLESNPIYKIFRNMIQRCYDPKSKYYEYYGGRGINICNEWLSNPESFIEWCISNKYKKGLQIDRHPNNDGNYEPNNCRFATPKENCNNRRSNIIIKFNERSQTLQQWAEEIGLKWHTLYARIYIYNWPIEDAMTIPLIDSKGFSKEAIYK